MQFLEKIYALKFKKFEINNQILKTKLKKTSRKIIKIIKDN